MPSGAVLHRVVFWSALAFVFLFIALLFGLIGAVGGWFIQLFIITLAVPVVLMIIDYRIGLVLAVLLLPYAGSPLVPKLGPLSIMNVLILGVCLAFALRWFLFRMVGRVKIVPVSRQLIWLYIVPLVAASMIGTLHLGEIAKHYLVELDITSYGLKEYWVSFFFKAMLLVAIAGIIGASVVERGRGQLFAVTMVTSAVIFVFASLAVMAMSGASLEQLRHARGFLQVLGQHNNGAGWLLIVPFSVALFSQTQLSSRLGRSALLLATLIIAVGIVITFSRGAVVAMVIVLGLYIWHAKRVGLGLAMITIIVAGAALAPEAIQERMMTGFGGESVTQQLTGRVEDDELTAGRIWIWQQLAPEIIRSPTSLLVGRGMSSVQWSAAARDGRYHSAHPHNLYLEMLMDLGVLGAAAVFAFYYYVWTLFKRLSVDSRIDPYMRGVFLGSLSGMMGLASFGLSNGHYFPAVEQLYFWVSIGLALGYERLTQSKDTVGALQRSDAASRIHTGKDRNRVPEGSILGSR